MSEQLLKRLEPFVGLDRDGLTTLARHSRVVRLAAGRRIDRPNDWLCYLLDGRVRLEAFAGGEQRVVSARDDAARRPLFARDDAFGVALTLEPCRVLWVDTAPLAFLLDDTRISGIAVTWLCDEAQPDGWAERFLARGLSTSPPALLQRLFGALQRLPFGDRESVIEEGTVGNELFIVARGRVEVRSRGGTRVLLDEGSVFGDDAIFGDGRRNASVRTVGSGRLMRLGEADFRALVLPAAVRWLPADAIAADARVIDLDLRRYRSIDARAFFANAPRGVEFAIGGGTRDARARWTWLAVRSGLAALAIL